MARLEDLGEYSVHEDPDRLPDGIPHAVIGLTVFYTLLLAIAVMLLWTGEMRAVAVAIAAVATPLLVARLARKAERDRDHVHPSR
jgi:membrane protein implicated in regulation of membrane protease activity